MSYNFLIDLLVDPLTKEPLLLDNKKNILRSPSGNIYPMIGSVPHLLIDESDHITKTTLHNSYKSEFNYRDHYQKDAEIFDYTEENISKITKDEFNRLHESILEEISNEMSVILDVGCGGSWVSKKLVPLGKKVISMDISTTNPINSIKQIPHINHAGLIADVYHLPIKENSIDCIIASEILEHIPDPGSFILRLLKVLKNNGKLIITTPYNEKIEYNLCIHCNKPTPRFAHLHSFDKKNIGQFIPKEGCSWHSKVFLNKYLIWSRSYIIMKYFPFKIWKLIDQFFNMLYLKPTRLKVVILKTPTTT